MAHLSLTFTGDFAPRDSVVRPLLLDSPTVINFEGPLVNRNDSAKNRAAVKVGPVLSNSALPDSNQRTILSLANNHIMDFGTGGLQETLSAISSRNSISALGAGLDSVSAEAPIVLEEKGVTVGLLARTEHQFGTVSDTQPGVATLAPSLPEDIRSLKEQVDHVVLIVHGGAEMVPWASPSRRALWRSYIDAGASVVVGNHSHVPSAWESYRSGVVFYGLGNFCVPTADWGWHPMGLWSLVPRFKFFKNHYEFEVRTSVIENLGLDLQVRESTKFEFLEHSTLLEELNQVQVDDAMLRACWQEAANRLYDFYFSRWLGFSGVSPKASFLEILRSVKGFFRSLAPSRTRKVMQANDLLRFHLFTCESHVDAISTSLGLRSGAQMDVRSECSHSVCDRYLFLDQ